MKVFLSFLNNKEFSLFKLNDEQLTIHLFAWTSLTFLDLVHCYKRIYFSHY